MAIITIDLSACHTRAQLAAGLNVPPAALDLVTLTSKPCRRGNGFPLTAALSNYGCCVLCSQTWYPRKSADSGAPAKYRRGHGLHGRQYQRRPVGGSATCCCSSPLCEEIGYAHGGMFHFPSSRDNCLEAARVLGLPQPERLKIAANYRYYKIAVWHFHADHRYRKLDGSWRLRNLDKYKDADGKVFSFPPPNASVQRFINQEITVEYDDALPLWVISQVRRQRRAMAAGSSLSPPPKEITPPRGRSRKKRGSPESEENVSLCDQMRVL